MPGRKLSLEHLIRDHKLDSVGVQETKKEDFPVNFLRNLTFPTSFNWESLPAKKTAGGILLGSRDVSLGIMNVSVRNLSISCMLQNKKDNFSWRLVVLYGSPYDESKPDFVDELHLVLSQWQGPPMIGGISTCVDLPLIKVMEGLT
jgi:hypothetical protein